MTTFPVELLEPSDHCPNGTIGTQCPLSQWNYWNPVSTVPVELLEPSDHRPMQLLEPSVHYQKEPLNLQRGPKFPEWELARGTLYSSMEPLEPSH